MGLPSTGSISMSQVNTELKKSATATISLNDSAVRKLAGKTSGTISMNDLRGKKASESVENYSIYNNSWEGTRTEGNITINLPHKVISGYLIVNSSCKRPSSGIRGYVEILNTKVNNKTVNIPLASGIKSFNLYYYTGCFSGSHSESPNKVNVDIKFTGEWEA